MSTCFDVAAPPHVAALDDRLSRPERSARTATLLDRIAECTDPAAAEELYDEVIVINRGVAEALAERYRGRGIPSEDLRQVAYEGLVKAVRRFDSSLDHDLLTYAVPTIRGELQRHFRDLGWMVRPPRRVQEIQWEVNRVIDRFTQRTGREPRRDELIDELGIDQDEYEEAMTAFGSFHPMSLDQPVSTESALTRADLLGGGDDHRRAAEARVVLGPLVRGLSQRDRRILYLRYFEQRTQQQIGDEIGVTQMQVSRIIGRILERLREQLDQAARPAPCGSERTMARSA